MSRGFYTLTSGMLTQQKKIDINSNNMANLNTPGYKKEQAVTSNFGNMFINKYKQNGIYADSVPLSNVSVIRVMEESNTLHSQGNLEDTELATDFAVMGAGFFGVNNDTGNTVYTRNGSFNVDQEGYLVLSHVGRVQGENGDVYIGTDKFEAYADGTISALGENIDKINVYDFADYNNLTKAGEGMFTSTVVPELLEYPIVANGTIERSNVNITEELSDIVSSQRALQTCAQALKLYNTMDDKAVNEIARIG